MTRKGNPSYPAALSRDARQYADRKARGVCPTRGCGAAPAPGKVRCATCLARLAGTLRAYRARLRAEGLCLCGAGPRRAGKVSCEACAEEQATRQRSWRAARRAALWEAYTAQK